MRKSGSARRVVSVRYRVSVYADVDLDRGEVVRVVEDDESARLDHDPTVGSRSDADLGLDVVETAFGLHARAYMVTITPKDAAQAIAIAETCAWPEWERP